MTADAESVGPPRPAYQEHRPAGESRAYREDMARRCAEDTERVNVTVGVPQMAADLSRCQRRQGWARAGQTPFPRDGARPTIRD
jgi:hypothetical protein